MTDNPEVTGEESSKFLFADNPEIEARDTSGKLYGFERTKSISGQPAQTIARTAQLFGQEDDITVLTVVRLPVMAEAAM
jgi:hypothetical protein